ncbi:MAG: hypothetical protein BAJATHORv1_20537 [Candidatus Thorarchaeota archaeon]|nr:MAG: hypothetical protein BAJATHORv1_20537 [Candidatus Thorarchaeota archaeon]
MSAASVEYKLKDVTAENVMNTVEACWNLREKGASTKAIAEYIDCSESTAGRALSCALQLGLIQKIGSMYYPSPDSKDISSFQIDQYHLIFSEAVIKYPPFIMFASQIGKGDSSESAARKTKVVYNFGLSANTTRKILVSWGLYSGLIESHEDDVRLSMRVASLDVKIIEELLESIQNEFKIRIYIDRRIGSDTYKLLGNSIDHLVSAIINHGSLPRHSVDDSGRILEDYLRLVGNELGLSLSGNGITQLAQQIYSATKITDKHREICEGIGAIRNAAAHSIDKKTGEIWTIHPEAALEIVLITLSTINSIQKYVSENQYVF